MTRATLATDKGDIEIEPFTDSAPKTAANFVNLPLAETGLYTFIVEIDGTEMRRLPMRVLTPPPGFTPPGAPVPPARGLSPGRASRR